MYSFDKYIWQDPEHFCYELVEVQAKHEQANVSHEMKSKYIIQV